MAHMAHCTLVVQGQGQAALMDGLQASSRLRIEWEGAGKRAGRGRREGRSAGLGEWPQGGGA